MKRYPSVLTVGLGLGLGGKRLRGGLLAVLLLLPVTADTQPRGDFRVWIQERYERWGPFGRDRNWEGSRVHGEGQFFPVNAGLWNVWWDASERGQELRFQGKDIPSRIGRLSLAMGDFPAYDPHKDPLRAEFQPSVWLRGLQLGLERESFSVGLRGGIQTRRQGLFGWGRSSLVGGSYGLSVSGPTGEESGWKADWDRQHATLLSGGLQHLRLTWGQESTEGLNLRGQARLSRQDANGRWGNSQILGAGYTTSRLQGQWHVRRISPSFQGLGVYRDPHANEWGSRLEVSYRPRGQVVVGTSWDWARDMKERAAGAGKETRLVSRFFVAAPVLDRFSLHGSVGYRSRSTPDPDSLLVDQGALSWSGTVSWNGTRARAALGVNRSLFRDPASTEGDWHENRYSGQGMLVLSDHVRVELGGWLVNRSFLDGLWASRERKFEGRIYWEPKSYQRGWLRFGRERLEARETVYSRDQWEMGAGWTQPLPWELALEAEMLFFVRAGDLSADRTRVNFRLSRRFIIGGGRLGLREDLPEFGTVEGRVYEDLNKNGYPDPDEPGVSGLAMKLGSGAEAATDAEGYYRFPEAATNLESVTLDLARLPTRYLAPEDSRVVVSLAPGENAVRNFAVRPSAGLAGRVVVDRGHRWEPARDVLIRVRGSHHDAFTDPEGRFYIPGLEAGAVTFEVMEWSVPKDTRAQTLLTKEVMLRPGETVYGGVIVLDHQPEKVLQRFRPDKD